MGSMILAIDFARKAGWAVLPGRDISDIIHGTTVIAPPGACIGQYGAGAMQFLDDMIAVHEPKCVAFEAPLPPKAQRNAEVARRLFMVAGLVEVACWNHGRIDCYEANVQEVKHHWAGSGGASKSDMIQAALDHGYKPTDDNAADALGLIAYTVHHRMKSVAPQFGQRMLDYKFGGKTLGS